MKKIIINLIFASFSAFTCEFSFDRLPLELSQTCLYKNIKIKKLNDQIYTFKPNYPLWTDGAQKNRWIYFPANSKIITDNKDNWLFPVGTIFWKEFSKNGLRIETRLIKKISNEIEGAWLFATYKWNDDESEAKLIEFGETGARGTDHDIPSKGDCQWCHGKYVKNPNGGWFTDIRVQGFDAIQLSSESAFIPECDTYQNPNPKLENTAKRIQLNDLISDKRLSNNYNWKEVAPKMLGDKIDQAALGYLHSNCSSCHGKTGQAQGLGIDFKNNMGIEHFIDLPSYLTNFNVPTRMYRRSENFMRIAPNDITKSAVWVRVNSKTPGEMMPKIGRKTVDPYGVCVLKKYIEKN